MEIIAIFLVKYDFFYDSSTYFAYKNIKIVLSKNQYFTRYFTLSSDPTFWN